MIKIAILKVSLAACKKILFHPNIEKKKKITQNLLTICWIFSSRHVFKCGHRPSYWIQIYFCAAIFLPKRWRSWIFIVFFTCFHNQFGDVAAPFEWCASSLNMTSLLFWSYRTCFKYIIDRHILILRYCMVTNQILVNSLNYICINCIQQKKSLLSLTQKHLNSSCFLQCWHLQKIIQNFNSENTQFCRNHKSHWSKQFKSIIIWYRIDFRFTYHTHFVNRRICLSQNDRINCQPYNNSKHIAYETQTN